LGVIRQKIVGTIRLSSVGQRHSRTHVRNRDLAIVIDEPLEWIGTSLGLTPTETLMSSLVGCSNVISNKIANKMGISFGQMEIALSVRFDRWGVNLMEEVERAFSNIALNFEVETDATPYQLTTIQTELEKSCPIGKVNRGSGATITKNRAAKPFGAPSR